MLAGAQRGGAAAHSLRAAGAAARAARLRTRRAARPGAARATTGGDGGPGGEGDDAQGEEAARYARRRAAGRPTKGIISASSQTNNRCLFKGCGPAFVGTHIASRPTGEAIDAIPTP